MNPIRLDLWREVGDGGPWDLSEEGRPAPTKDEIRQRFVAALSAVPDGDESALAEFVQKCREAIKLSPPYRRQNLAPFGFGRLAGARTRTVTRQKALEVRRDIHGYMCGVTYEFDDDGSAVMETVQITERSGTGHILDVDGQALCGVPGLELVVKMPGARTDGLRAICRACQKARTKMPWPETVYPGEDPTGGVRRRLVDFEEFARERGAR